MADFSAFYWSRHIFAGDRHWMDREAAVALKKLKMVSMPSRAYTSFLHCGSCSRSVYGRSCVNALSGLYLISTPEWMNGISVLMIVSMPSRAYTSFLRYPFKNLGFMRFPEPVFAGIYQNILTAAVFRAC